MNKMLSDFAKYANEEKEKFITQFGDAENIKSVLTDIWNANYKNSGFVWVYAGMVKNFDSEVVPKLESIGISVFKANYDDYHMILDERLVVWNDNLSKEFKEFNVDKNTFQLGKIAMDNATSIVTSDECIPMEIVLSKKLSEKYNSLVSKFPDKKIVVTVVKRIAPEIKNEPPLKGFIPRIIKTSEKSHCELSPFDAFQLNLDTIGDIVFVTFDVAEKRKRDGK